MTHGGQAVPQVSIGCTESYLDKKQHAARETGVGPCTLPGKRGSRSRILEKGKQVYVEGSLSTS